MKLSSAGNKLIITNEGEKSTMYLDSRGIPTIGIGHLILQPSENYLLTATLTQDQIENLFIKDIARVETWINQNCIWNPSIKQCEFDALCSFLHQYNIDKYPNTKAAIINGDRTEIINAILQFRNIVAGSGDNELLPRRQREIAMFKGIYPSSIN
jgi:lysozyme